MQTLKQYQRNEIIKILENHKRANYDCYNYDVDRCLLDYVNFLYERRNRPTFNRILNKLLTFKYTQNLLDNELFKHRITVYKFSNYDAMSNASSF